MKADEQIKALLEKVNSGLLDKHLSDLEGGDLGIYIPAEKNGNILKPLSQGFSQTENNLRISISRTGPTRPEDCYIVGWMGGTDEQGSQCRGSHNSCIGHCKGTHGGPIKNCRNHPNKTAISNELVAPELNYESALEQLKTKGELLNLLAKEGFGLTLLHGHNRQFKFTKLPPDHVAVISRGITHFRTLQETRSDPTFIPTTWRCMNGKWQIAGGHSDQ